MVLIPHQKEDKDKVIVPDDVKSREAYKELESKGLLEVPPLQHCGLYFHRTTKQWHAKYGIQGEFNSAPTYNSSLRSEKKAMLLALRNMWKWYSGYTKKSPDAKMLAMIELELESANTPF